MLDRLNLYIQGFNRLGLCIRGLEQPDIQADFDRQLAIAIEHSIESNRWFTEITIRSALAAISDQMLDQKKLHDWLQKYPSKSLLHLEIRRPVVGVILAGNLPLVGAYDVLCVLISGAKLKVKFSSKDAFLIPLLLRFLVMYIPQIEHDIEIIAHHDLGEMDALLATGTKQSIDKIASQWQHIPRLLRSARTSIAVLDGTETLLELEGLVRDVCLYYGMGCRSVNKLFLPKGFIIDALVQIFQKAGMDSKFNIQHSEYQTIIKYNKARMTLLGTSYVDAGSVLLVQSEDLFAPVGCLFYTFYEDTSQLQNVLLSIEDSLQVIVCSQNSLIPERLRTVPLGNSQSPGLEDAPDGLDVVDFLLQLATSPKK